MPVDPDIVRLHAENVRAEVLFRSSVQLDDAIIQKITQKVRVFQGMGRDCLMRTLALADHLPFPPEHVVFREGDIGSSFYVLIAGEVVVEKERAGRPVTLARLGPGECFGEMALVGAHLRTATVRALTRAIAMRFDRERIDAYSESARVIYRNIAGVLAQRLGESSELLADLVSRQPPPDGGDL